VDRVAVVFEPEPVGVVVVASGYEDALSEPIVQEKV
jgi:hypothetical protein